MKVDNSIEFDKFNDDEEEEVQTLIEWMKEYAIYAGPKTIRPTLEEVRIAIKDDFPELYSADLDLDHLLEELGIHIIVDYLEYTVAWLGTTDEETVESFLLKYQGEHYSNVRKKLGIKHLWVIKLLPHLGHMRNDIFEALVQFDEIEDKPECVIIDL